MTTNDGEDALVELDAMRLVAGALQQLAPSARQRVLRWAVDRFGVASEVSSAATVPVEARPPYAAGFEAAAPHSPNPETTLGELYAACDPQTDADKTLVVAYWLQEVEGNAGIDAQRVNTELKHLGYGVGNITRAFEKLKDSRPQLVIQTKKAGTTKQARKTYRVTAEGKRLVQNLRGSAG